MVIEKNSVCFGFRETSKSSVSRNRPKDESRELCSDPADTHNDPVHRFFFVRSFVRSTSTMKMKMPKRQLEPEKWLCALNKRQS